MPEGDAICERLAKLVEVAGSQRKLADIVGKTGPAVHGWIHGSVPQRATLKSVAERTGVSSEWLALGEGDEETELGNFRRRLEAGVPTKRSFLPRTREDPLPYGVQVTKGLTPREIPVVSMAQAGDYLSSAWEDVEDFETVETYLVKDPRAIAVRIRGDSMAPAYREGTVAILYPSVQPQSDHLVVAKLKNGSVLFKRLHIVGDRFHFLSNNPKYDPVVVSPEDVVRMMSVGKTERDEL